MNIKYIDLIHQSYYFPQEEFTLEDENLRFHGIELEKLVAQYGTPLKFTYLPKISENSQRATSPGLLIQAMRIVFLSLTITKRFLCCQKK